MLKTKHDKEMLMLVSYFIANLALYVYLVYHYTTGNDWIFFAITGVCFLCIQIYLITIGLMILVFSYQYIKGLITLIAKSITQTIVKSITQTIVKLEVPTSTHKSKQTREDIANRLKKQRLVFFEENSRMSYGLIGHLNDSNDKKVIQIFETSFYCLDKDLSLYPDRLALIADIQKEYFDLTRDEHNRIIVDKNGVGK